MITRACRPAGGVQAALGTKQMSSKLRHQCNLGAPWARTTLAPYQSSVRGHFLGQKQSGRAGGGGPQRTVAGGKQREDTQREQPGPRRNDSAPAQGRVTSSAVLGAETLLSWAPLALTPFTTFTASVNPRGSAFRSPRPALLTRSAAAAWGRATASHLAGPAAVCSPHGGRRGPLTHSHTDSPLLSTPQGLVLPLSADETRSSHTSPP